MHRTILPVVHSDIHYRARHPGAHWRQVLIMCNSLAVCPFDGLVRWQQDEDGPYCIYCHEPVTIPIQSNERET